MYDGVWAVHMLNDHIFLPADIAFIFIPDCIVIGVVGDQKLIFGVEISIGYDNFLVAHPGGDYPILRSY